MKVRPVRGTPRRDASAARTRQAILGAARRLVRDSPRPPTVGQVARLAGVSRLSVYHHFGSHAGVLQAVAAAAASPPSSDDLHSLLSMAATHWAADPALHRRLPESPISTHELAARLAVEDRLRPGCSIKEAEDVIAVLASFATFDRLHQDGRRSTHTVVEILTRMAGSILNHPP